MKTFYKTFHRKITCLSELIWQTGRLWTPEIQLTPDCLSRFMSEVLTSYEPLCKINQETNLETLTTSLREVRDNPYSFECGYQTAWDTENSVISYTRSLYSSTNVPGGLDISSGLFTAGHSGTWAVPSPSVWGDILQLDIFTCLVV